MKISAVVQPKIDEETPWYRAVALDTRERPGGNDLAVARIGIARWFTFALVGALIGGASATAYAALAPRYYEVSAFVDVAALRSDAAVAFPTALENIAAATRAPANLAEAKRHLDIEGSLADFADRVVVKPMFANPAVRVTVQGWDPEESELIARYLIDEIVSMPVRGEGTRAGPDYLVDRRDATEIPDRPTTPKPSHDIPAGTFLGLAAGLVAATLGRKRKPQSTLSESVPLND